MRARQPIFFISIVFAVVSFLAIPFANKVVTNKLAKPPQIAKVVSILKQRTERGITASKQLASALVEDDGATPFELFTPSLAQRLNDDGIAVFLFRNDSLAFWSESLDVYEVPEQSNQLVKVQNVWCTSYWMAIDNVKALVLIKIKNNFSYENQFLENRFHSSLDFLEGYNLLPNGVSGSFPVALYGAAPVFYLTYIPKDFDFHQDNLISFLAWVGFTSMLVAMFMLFLHPAIRSRKVLSSSILAVSLAGIRLITLWWDVMPKGHWMLFKAEVFATGWYAPSVGDLLLNSLILFGIVAYAYKPITSIDKKRRRTAQIVSIFSAFLAFCLFIATGELIKILVLNSTVTLEAYQIFNLSVFSVIEYVIISLFFATAALCLIIARVLIIEKPKWKLFLWWLGLIVISVFLNYILFHSFNLVSVLLLIGIAWVFVNFEKKNRAIHTSTYLIFIFLLSSFSVWIVSHNALQKDREIRKLLAINLANERDFVAEVHFPQLARQILMDTNVTGFLDEIEDNEEHLYEYIHETFLSSYFNKYDFQLTVCFSYSRLHIENTHDVMLCYEFFEKMLNEYGIRIPGSNFYFLNNQNGRISYLGMFEYVLQDGSEACVYMELDSKLTKELLGYPELLMDKSTSSKKQVSDYSSAKYFQGNLVAFTGSYSYPLKRDVSGFEQEYDVENVDGFNHLVYNDGAGTTVVLSRSRDIILHRTASLAWVFLFFYLIISLWFSLAGVVSIKQNALPSFKSKLRITMVLVLFLSLILVGMVTIAFNVRSFQRKNLDSLNEKLISVMVDIENNILSTDLLNPDYHHFLTPYLIELSNVFHSDINLYDIRGDLLASSRPEIFERNLYGTKINPNAWFELDAMHTAKLVHSESIGNLEYLSAYAPLFNLNNEKVAYLNLPYFTRQGEFIQEVASVIVALINIFAFLIFVAILTAVFISNQILKPLDLIRHRIATIDITKHMETIDYTGRDEVGQLVSEYNRMVVELAESAKQLAQSQRQSAWREMAKQVAHEIKNPLTPIKLNLQLLVKAKNEGHPDWDNLFNRFSNTLSEQIDSLSGIASEFSAFAQMPAGHFAAIDLTEILQDSMVLFSAYPNIETLMQGDFNRSYLVHADREQLQRVFVNLLTNAVQAIGKDKKGIISVSVMQVGQMVQVSVADNGVGVATELKDKLFNPNFTTKSGGTGLGLAISKNIIELIGGTITFKTKSGEGTVFIVEIPLL